jgi:hypothetical protein
MPCGMTESGCAERATLLTAGGTAADGASKALAA